MQKPFDPTKPVQTRDGRNARIICTDRVGQDQAYNIVALVRTPVSALSRFPSVEQILSFTNDGLARRNAQSPEDLVNVPVKHKRTFWVNVYPDTRVYEHNVVFGTRKAADNHPSCNSYGNRVGCVKVEIECEEGEGL